MQTVSEFLSLDRDDFQLLEFAIDGKDYSLGQSALQLKRLAHFFDWIVLYGQSSDDALSAGKISALKAEEFEGYIVKGRHLAVPKAIGGNQGNQQSSSSSSRLAHLTLPSFAVVVGPP